MCCYCVAILALSCLCGVKWGGWGNWYGRGHHSLALALLLSPLCLTVKCRLYVHRVYRPSFWCANLKGKDRSAMLPRSSPGRWMADIHWRHSLETWFLCIFKEKKINLRPGKEVSKELYYETQICCCFDMAPEEPIGLHLHPQSEIKGWKR